MQSVHLLELVVFRAAVAMRCHERIVVAVVRQVKGGAVAVVEHRHLQVLLLVQRLLPAAVV